MNAAGPIERLNELPSGEHVDVLYVDPSETAPTVRERLDSFDPITVERVPNGATARDRVAAGPVDCVVSEYALPDEDGLSLLTGLREQRPSLPFVLFTDDGDETVASDAIAADVSEYLRRTPLDEQFPELVAAVTRAVESQSQRSSILDRMTDAFLALDTDWELTYLNERGREVICAAAGQELTIDSLVGTDIWRLLPEAVDTVFYDEYHEAVSSGEPVTFEAEYEPLDTWFEVRAYPSPDGLSVYFRDVTDRRNQIAQLRQREEVLKEMYRVVSAKDLAFDEQVDRLLDIGREVLGTDYGALSRQEGGDYVFEIVHDPTGDTEPGDRVQLDQTTCERAIVTEQTLVLEDIARDAPELTSREGFTDMGISCYLGTPVVVDGDIYGTFCFYSEDPREEPFSDWEITLVELLGNWVSYEQERRRNRRELTRERNRLDEFAGVVSHDLRNPLGVALGRIDAARETGDDEHFDAIERSLERMDDLIDDVLTAAREGESVQDPGPVDIVAIANEAWAIVDAGAATLAVDAPGRYLGDATRLQQLLENLCVNAVEHGGEDVTITVSALANGRGFYVADDGPGVPAEKRDEIFEAGYTTSEEGTGFGLKIVEEVAHAHGATVRVTESADGGARFEIRDLRPA